MSSKEKPAFALEDTLAVYGIRTNPFPIGEVDDFYFATPELAKQQDALRNLVEYGDLILVVSGVEGAGKTAFLRSFLLAPGERWRCCRIDPQAHLTIDSLIEAMLEGFGVRVRGDDSTGDESLLRAHLAQMRANDEVALVVVDDAHLMPQVCLEFLLSLAEQGDEPQVRLLLASEPGELGISTADTKRVHVVVLKPFDVQQCADYVNTRLSRAGLVGDSPFDAGTVEGMHMDSGGVPGSIHPFALHTLLANADTSPARRGARASLTVLAYAAALIVVVGVAALLLRPPPAVDEAGARDPAATGRIGGLATPAGAAVGERGDLPPSATPGAEAGPSADIPSNGDGASRTAMRTPAADTSRALAHASIGQRPGATHPVAPAVAPTIADTVADTVADAVALGPAPEKPATSPGDDAANIRLASNVTPKSAGLPSPSAGARENDWLARQDPSHFVLQLVGTRDAAAARGFVERYGLAGKGTWLATTHEGKPWYVVVYGSYPDRASARAAIDTLPDALRARKPWPRTLASLAAKTP